MSTPRNPHNDTSGKAKYQGNLDKINAQNPPEQSFSNFVGDTFNLGVSTAKRFGRELYTAAGFAKENRSINLPTTATEKAKSPATARFSTAGEEADWRVKLSLPQQFAKDGLLTPLHETGAFVFPYTPTIIVGHSANYNSLQPVHTNYPFQIYESSSVQEIVITGDFTVENASEGRYWIAAMHYLRSVTKMFYGDSDNAGSPPPIIRLNGYGDYVFNNVPCVVTNFTIDLPADVDYIATPIGDLLTSTTAEGVSTDGKGTAWVPTQSLITVTLQPTYSRKTVSKFNLNKFVNGDFVNGNTGFI